MRENMFAKLAQTKPTGNVRRLNLVGGRLTAVRRLNCGSSESEAR